MANQPEVDVEAALGAELLALHRDSYGAGAQSAHAHILEDAVVCFLDGLELMASEEFLIEAGHETAVLDVRTRYQQAIETTFRAAVERHTGRRVVSFASMTKLNPSYVVEVFRLAPRQRETPV